MVPLAVLSSHDRASSLSVSMSLNLRPFRKLILTYFTAFSTFPLDWGSDLRQKTGWKCMASTKAAKAFVISRSPRFSLCRNTLSWS